MTLTSLFYIVLITIFLTGTYVFAFIKVRLELKDITLPYDFIFFVYIYSMVVPLSLVALFYTLIKVFVVVPTYVYGKLPFYIYVGPMLFFIYGFVKAVLLWDTLANRHTSIELRGLYAMWISQFYINNRGTDLYVSVTSDWHYRVQIVILYTLLGKFLIPLLRYAAKADHLYFFLQSSNPFLCILFTECVIFTKVSFLVFAISGLPPYIYFFTTVLLFTFVFIKQLLKFNSNINRYYILRVLKDMEGRSESDKMEFILRFLQDSLPAEVLLDEFCTRDYYMSAILLTDLSK